MFLPFYKDISSLLTSPWFLAALLYYGTYGNQLHSNKIDGEQLPLIETLAGTGAGTGVGAGAMEVQMGQSRSFDLQRDDITSLAKANRFSGNGNDNQSERERKKGR